MLNTFNSISFVGYYFTVGLRVNQCILYLPYSRIWPPGGNIGRALITQMDGRGCKVLPPQGAWVIEPSNFTENGMLYVSVCCPCVVSV